MRHKHKNGVMPGVGGDATVSAEMCRRRLLPSALMYRRGLLPVVLSAAVGLFAVTGSEPVMADLTWEPPSGEASHGHSHGRRGNTFQLTGARTGHDATAVEVTLIHPDLETRSLPLSHQQTRVGSTGMGNYHALVARQKGTTYEFTAIRYLYLHGRPTGHSPSELTEYPISKLELVPDPLPREHWRYVTSKPETFRLIFDGQPLMNSPVTLTTRAGTEHTLLTDNDGVLRVVFPEDFAEVIPGRRKNAPGEWQLSSYIRKEGVLYRTTLSGAYSPNSHHWQSYTLGVAVAGLGFGAGLLLNRRLPMQNRRRKS